MIIRMMIILLVLGSFAPSAYSQIATTTPASRCGEGTLVLGATATSGTIKWYDVPFYGTAVATGDSFTTPSMSVTKTYYVDAVGDGNCSLNTNQARVPVIATISAGSIQAAIFYTSNTFCKSVSGDQLVTRTGTAGGVYSATAGGLTLNPSTGAITPTSSNNGTYTVTYHITTPASGCTEADATTSVTITTTPAIPVISYTGSPFCTSPSSLVTVSRSGASGGTFSASPTGLTIDSSTGTITPAISLSGTYTVTLFVPGSGGCDAMTAQATGITILQLPTASISYASATYTINQGTQSVSLSGTGVYTGGVYSSTTGLTIDGTSGTITPASSTAGTYTVTYTLASVTPCGAPTPATTTVTIYPLPTATIASNQTVCRNSAAPNITFTGSGGTAPYTFTYKINSGPDQTVTTTSDNSVPVSQPTAVIGASTYALTSISDSHGSTQSVSGQTATITVSPIPVATFTYAGSPYCSSGTNPTPTMLEGGVTGGFSVPEADVAKLIFASSSTGEINLTASTAGTYTVTNTIAAAGGCGDITATASVIITKLPVATFSYVGSPYCSDAGAKTATLGSGATAGLFTSTPGLVFLNTVTGEVDLANSIAGTYTVTNTVGEASGCGEVSATSLIQIDNATTVGTTYFDYGSIFSRCQAAGSVIFNATAQNATSIIYTLDATTTTGGNTINAGTGAVTFAADWVGTGSVVTATSTAHCGNTTTEHITINTNPNVVVGATTFALVGSTSSRCQGAGIVTYSATADNSNSILYQLDAASEAGGNSISQFTGDVTYVANWYGTSTISASATANCANTTTSTHMVTTYPTTVAGSIASSTVCTGGNSTGLTLSGNIGNVLKWQYSSDNFTLAENIHDVENTTTSLTASNLTAITYYRAQVKSGDCSAAFTSPATITVVPVPSISKQPAETQSNCLNATPTDLIFAATGGTGSFSYQWYSNSGASTSGASLISGATNGTFTPPTTVAETKYYYCIITQAGSGCGTLTSNFAEVIVYSQFRSGAIATTGQTICSAGTPTEIGSTTDASGGNGTITYQWQSSLNADFTGTPTDISSNAPTYTPVAGLTATTWYRRMAYDATCQAGAPLISTGTWLVTVNPILTASVSIAAVPSGEICAGTSVTFTATPTNGGTPTYQWKIGGTNISGQTGVAYSYTPLNGEKIIVWMTSHAIPCSFGSPAPSNEITMVVNAIPGAPTATSTQSFCSSATHTVADLAILTGTAPKWYAAETGGIAKLTTETLVTATEYWASQTVSVCESSARVKVTATVNAATTYYRDADADGYGNPSVTEANCTGAPSGYVTNSTDCDDTDAAKHPVSVAAIAGGAATVCVGATTPAFTNATSGGTWEIVTGTGNASVAATGIVTGMTAGKVTVKYTAPNGCGSNATTELTVIALPTPSFTAQPGVSAIVNNSVIYITESGKSNYVWIFPGTVTTDYTITSGGTSADNTVTLKYVTTGSKTVSINYTDNGCTAASATTSTATMVVAAPVIGDAYQGGKIFYILQPTDPGYNASVQHGLIAATADQGTNIAWITGGSTQSTANSNTLLTLGTGQANTNFMKAQTGYTGGAAKVCDDYTSGGYNDWYLPSRDELMKLWANLGNTSGMRTTNGFRESYYWSSSEDSDIWAWNQTFTDGGSQNRDNKSNNPSVRAIRSF